MMMTDIEIAATPETVQVSRHDGVTIERSLTDPDVFGAIFDQYFDAVYGYVARRFGRGVADDVAANVFVEAFASRQRFDVSCSNARPWLFGITANLLRRMARQDRAQWKAFASHGHDPIATGAAPRLDEVAVARALAAISQEEREALLLLVWADLAYDDIASALGVPIGTVRSRINRARTKLRGTLEDLR